MKENELRVSNLVIKTNTWDNSELVHKFELRDFHNLELFKPIPLTEEWLVKFGLNNLNSITTKGGDFFIELENKELGIGGYDSCTSGMNYYATCEYVHQLQNLYFVLTNEELQLK